MRSWKRQDKIALASLIVSIVGAVATLLQVYEVRQLIGLKEQNLPYSVSAENRDTQESVILQPNGSQSTINVRDTKYELEIPHRSITDMGLAREKEMVEYSSQATALGFTSDSIEGN